MLVGKLSALLNPATYIIVNVGDNCNCLVWWKAGVCWKYFTGRSDCACQLYVSDSSSAYCIAKFLIVSFTKGPASASRINEVFEQRQDIVDGEYDREESNKSNMVIFDEVSMSYSRCTRSDIKYQFRCKRGETVGVSEEPDRGNRRWSI